MHYFLTLWKLKISKVQKISFDLDPYFFPVFLRGLFHPIIRGGGAVGQNIYPWKVCCFHNRKQKIIFGRDVTLWLDPSIPASYFVRFFANPLSAYDILSARPLCGFFFIDCQMGVLFHVCGCVCLAMYLCVCVWLLFMWVCVRGYVFFFVYLFMCCWFVRYQKERSIDSYTKSYTDKHSDKERWTQKTDTKTPTYQLHS